ncbi:MAG: SlyX family protein [Pseudomonadales bacterium]|nr:SlyX family protein [Pseudomonadales bacterium]
MSEEDMIDAIIDLQMRCAHQEDALQALVSGQRAQQRVIDELRLQVKWLAENLRQLKSGDSDGDPNANEVPPHY